MHLRKCVCVSGENNGCVSFLLFLLIPLRNRFPKMFKWGTALIKGGLLIYFLLNWFVTALFHISDRFDMNKWIHRSSRTHHAKTSLNHWFPPDAADLLVCLDGGNASTWKKNKEISKTFKNSFDLAKNKNTHLRRNYFVPAFLIYHLLLSNRAVIWRNKKKC